MRKCFYLASSLILLASCQTSNKEADKVQAFLDAYNSSYQKFTTDYQNAQWNSNTHIVAGDSTNALAERKAGEAYSAFAGADSNLNKAKELLKDKEKLTPLQVLELNRIIYLGANDAASQQKLIKQRISTETKQTEALYGFNYSLAGKPVSTNFIDSVLVAEKDLTKRQQAWEASKEVGKGMKTGLVTLVNLRNKITQASGYKDYFDYSVSEYGMTTDEMLTLLHSINVQLYPLFRELHTYARYELAKKYNAQQIPDYLPAHWLPNRWAQDWSPMVSVNGLNLDKSLASKTPEWIVKTAEDYYVSMGFSKLPETFWQKSSLYPVAPTAAYKKNNHASCWHINLDDDIRSLMSVQPNTQWFGTAHHELGHGYYFMSYSNKDVPFVLRNGANRAFHEAVGNLIQLVAEHASYLQMRGLADSATKTDPIQALLKEALNNVAFIPFAAGTMPQFEHELYSNNLSPNDFNKKWWEIAKKYQGIEPPTARGEEYCDAATKIHLTDDPAKYYDYALSYIIVYQLNDFISKNLLHQDPHESNFYNSKEVGSFLKKILMPGMTQDWRKLLKDNTGEDLSARAMLEYYKPLYDYLKKANEGRKYTLPETIQ